MRRSLIRSVGPGMALLTLGLLAIGLVKLGPHPTLAHRPNSPATTVKVNKPQVAENYGKLPLSFEANQGQTDGIVKLRLTAVFDAQYGGFETGWSAISWGSIGELFVNLTMPAIVRRPVGQVDHQAVPLVSGRPATRTRSSGLVTNSE